MTPILVLAFAFAFICALVGNAFGFDGELTEVQTVSPLTDQILVWLGVATVIAGTLAAVLPPHWRITQILARFSTDLRAVRTPDPAKTTKLPDVPPPPPPRTPTRY